MCRDKFVFGLHDILIHTELLKTHLKLDNTTEKGMEAAQRTNQLITDTSKSLDEQVHHTQFRKKHSDMKLKREPNTCHWYGSFKGPRPWAGCPAKGKTCSRCDGNDHFATVCLEPLGHEPPSRFNQQYPSNRGKGRGTQSRGRGRGGQFQQQNNYQLLQQQTVLPNTSRLFHVTHGFIRLLLTSMLPTIRKILMSTTPITMIISLLHNFI